jgi:hypothetical protein
VTKTIKSTGSLTIEGKGWINLGEFCS